MRYKRNKKMNLKKIFIFMMVGICLFQLPVANAKNNSAKNKLK